MRSLSLVLLAACSTSMVLPVDQASPPLTLDVSAVVARQPMSLTAGGLPPNRAAYFVASINSTGSGLCAPGGALCMTMDMPNWFLGSAMANANGEATLTLTVPNAVPPRELYFQAGAILGGVGELSPVVGRLPGDSDLDGVAGADDCDDADDTVYTGAAEVCGDGIDQDCDGADSSCGPNLPPTFGGITGLSLVQDRSDTQIMVTWDPATDDSTPASDIVYGIFISTIPGAQDFSNPTALSPAGATSMVLTRSPGAGQYTVVRAMDADGAMDDNTVSQQVFTLSLNGRWERDLAQDSPFNIDAPCFGAFTADLEDMWLELSGTGYAGSGMAMAQSIVDNTPYGGGLSTDAIMSNGMWASDGMGISLAGINGTVQNSNCDGGFICDFACALNGGFFDMSVGAGGSADGQVEQFNYPSTTDTSGLTMLPYAIWTDGSTEYLTIMRSAEVPPQPDQHFSR